MNKSEQIDYFYKLSEILTGYDLVVLYGTGQGDFYFTSIQDILGEELVTGLLNEFELAFNKLPSKSARTLEDMIKNGLFVDDKWCAVCKNIIKMWYMGNWYQMPKQWRQNYVSSIKDTDKVLSTNSYIQGLVWKAMGRHPKSAKQPGYATWSFPPQENNG